MAAVPDPWAAPVCAAAPACMTRHRRRFAQHLEAQCAGRGDGFHEPHFNGIAETEAAPAAVADQRVRFLHMAPELATAERRGRNETVGAGIPEPHEET